MIPSPHASLGDGLIANATGAILTIVGFFISMTQSVSEVATI
jgi:hypothetical protein